MEQFQTLAVAAHQAFKTADHLAYITYPVVHEKKLLIVVLQNIHLCLSKALEALLNYHAYHKEISYVPHDFESRVHLFRSTLLKKYRLDPSFIDFFLEIAEIMRHHQTSSIEFVRKDTFIMASENFRLKTITIEKVKSYLSQTKVFLETVNGALAHYDRRFS